MANAQLRRLASIATVTFASAALLSTACGDSESIVGPSNSGGGGEVAKMVATPLQDLHDIEDLRAEFRGDVGSTRIVLLLSPT